MVAHRKRALLAGIILLAALCFSPKTSAQPDVEIWWDPTNIADTVMDFGVTLEGAPVRLTFSVVNKTSRDVGILSTNPDADPYYQIVNTPSVPPESPRKEEFQPEFPRPYIVPTGDTGHFGVIYQARPNNPQFPPDVVTEAWLEIRVVSMHDSLGASVDKRFLLRALKTLKVLASTKVHVPFDSVYVDPKPIAPSEEYKIESVVTFPIPVVGQHLEMQTSVIGQPEITVDTLENASFGPRGSLVWNPEYHPRDRGMDSALFKVAYKVNPNAQPDTVVTSISGIGVEQILTVVSATGDPQPIEVRGDTIDFGGVNADGKGGVVATVVIQNQGNVNARLTAETENGIPRDTAAYKVERSLSSSGVDIKTNRLDTLQVRFEPVDGGDHYMRYDIHTDLLQRPIKGVPDGAQTKSIHFVGFSRKPQMQVSPPSVDFGTVVLLPECQSAAERSITIRNVGNVELLIDSVRIEPADAPIFVNPTSARIEKSQSQDLQLRFEPTDLDMLTAKLILFTNAFGVPYEIPLTGNSIGPDSIFVRIDSNIKARPGTPITVPVRVDGDRVTLAETSTVTITFEPTLLAFRNVVTEGTASEGASILRAVEDPKGVFTLELDANGAFTNKDVLVNVLFDTYLGTLARTSLDLSPQTTQFGNAGCASVLDVTVESGAFALDSVCGLSYLTGSQQTLMIEAALFPNPAADHVRVTVTSGEEQSVTVRVLDSYGRVATSTSTNLNQGISFVPLNLSNELSGPYFVEVSTALQRLVLPLVIER